MKQIEALAKQYLEQHYFVDSDGLLHTPVGRIARNTVRVGRTIYQTAPLAVEMQRQTRLAREQSAALDA